MSIRLIAVFLSLLVALTAGSVLAQESTSDSAAPSTQETPDKKKREPIYDEQADARVQIAEALAKASSPASPWR